MEVVANKLVSETPVLEGAALEELKALLDLQMKMFIEGLDELFAARDAKLDALFARSGASTSGGSGVLDTTEAQEVTLDLNLAATATSAINDEPSDIDFDAPSSCSTKCPNRVFDVSMPVPACTIAEEIVPDTVLVVAASVETTAEPSDINIGTASSCSTEFPNLIIDDAPLVPELFLDPILGFDASSAVGIEPSTIHIGMPITCLTKCLSVFIDIMAPAVVYATAEEVMLDHFHAPPSDLATGCITIVLSDGPDIIVDAGLAAYWMDIHVMLETSNVYPEKGVFIVQFFLHRLGGKPDF
ncbi:hypothetical protein EJB05_31518 [Eragrostis curvula]|uniref:Uncharacterized protein n=1 Tax=Eragrostis curvula TaxID=38414 RepID=A0A5J9UDR0_9POAL|nr:hypothetical protein EJB05_31518 [Eragrostis curvula]